MTSDRLRDMLQKRPFAPFTIKLADGTRIPVKHPELVLVFPSGRTAHVVTGAESFEIIDLLLVTSLEVQNGRHRSARSRLR